MGAGQGRAGNPGGTNQTPPMPTPPVNKNKPLDLTKMTDGELVDFVDESLNLDLPDGFFDDITQRMIYLAKWNDKPEVVSTSTLKKLAQNAPDDVLYRTVKDAYVNGKTITADSVVDDIVNGDINNTAGYGGQAYGGGMYFADDITDSRGYGNHRNDSRTIAVVLNKKAKIIEMEDVKGKMGADWVKKHPKVARRLGLSVNAWGGVSASVSSFNNRKTKVHEGVYTAMAMAMGYNGVKNDVGARTNYYTIFDRSVWATDKKDYFTKDFN